MEGNERMKGRRNQISNEVMLKRLKRIKEMKMKGNNKRKKTT